jgi:hypothetical protein
MTNAFLRGSSLGRLAALALGLLVTAGLLGSLEGTSYGQFKKATPKVTPKTPPPTPAPKAAPEPPQRVIQPGQLPATGDPTVAFVNRYFAKVWEQNQLEHSLVVSDYEFIRRASLDIIGRIATVEEINRFLNDPPQTRRAQLIDRLLASEEYASNWATIWTTWLLTRSGSRANRDQMKLWLEEKFGQNVPYKEIVAQLLTASGRTNENGAVTYILAHLGEPVPANKRAEEGQFEMVPITSRTTRLFLGLQTQCTQCHDHTFNPEWRQNHFWGVNAFFRQVEAIGVNPKQKQKDVVQQELKDNTDFNRDGIVYFEKRNGVVLPTKAKFLDGRTIPATAKSRREALAELVTSHDMFAKAYVNRMWGHFFGRGLCQQAAVDDFGEHNPLVHPELLDRLARDFITGGYDTKKLIKWITCSKPYHLSTAANSSNEKEDAAPFFSRMNLKAMSPEQLYESLQVATNRVNAGTGGNNRQAWIDRLVQNFGDDEGNEVTFNGTVVQALLMMNGQDINNAINNGQGTVAQALKNNQSPRGVMNDLFLAALNRRASDQEFKVITEKFRMRIPERDAAAPWQDLFWALLNSNEFILNH